MISGVMKETWPAMIVQKPGSIFASWKITSSEIPRTRPGATSGLASSAWSTAPPRSFIRCRISDRASAAKAEIRTATNATLRLYSMALTIFSSSKSAVYHLVVKPS